MSDPLKLKQQRCHKSTSMSLLSRPTSVSSPNFIQLWDTSPLPAQKAQGPVVFERAMEEIPLNHKLSRTELDSKSRSNIKEATIQ